MVARWVLYNLRRGARSTAETVADQTVAQYREEPGFRGMSLLFQDALGEFAILSFWDTKEQAEGVGRLSPPAAYQYLHPFLQGPPVTRVFEVYETVGVTTSVDGRHQA